MSDLAGGVDCQEPRTGESERALAIRLLIVVSGLLSHPLSKNSGNVCSKLLKGAELTVS